MLTANKMSSDRSPLLPLNDIKNKEQVDENNAPQPSNLKFLFGLITAFAFNLTTAVSGTFVQVRPLKMNIDYYFFTSPKTFVSV